MTEKLYDKAPYDTEFEAHVVSCTEIQDDKYELVLDRTLFFPEEGGQTPDRGEIWIRNEAEDSPLADKDYEAKAVSGSDAGCSGIRAEVVDVQMRGDEIVHTVVVVGMGEPPLRIHGRIDWSHRYDNMQQHTGEHIFSGLVNSRFGYDNVGFHLSDNEVTMDYNGMLTDEDVAELETEANRIIRAGAGVFAEYPPADVLAGLSYRSKKELSGAVRIVTIRGNNNIIDICACCAPHVKNTGEIGLFKVVSRQNYKKGVRLSIVCGSRAIALFQKEHLLLQNLAGSLTTSVENIPDRLEKFRDENGKLKGALSQALYDNLLLRAGSIPAGSGILLLFTEGIDNRTLRRAAETILADRGGTCALFSRTPDGSMEYILGDCEGLAKEYQQKLSDALQAKGGGAANMVQGRVNADEEAIRDILMS